MSTVFCDPLFGSCDLNPHILLCKSFKLISPLNRELLALLKCQNRKHNIPCVFCQVFDICPSVPGANSDKTHIPCSAVTQSCSDASTSPLNKKKARKSASEPLDLVCNALFALGGYVCNVSHSLLSHWVCWHTVSGSRLRSTRSILRFRTVVDMATKLVD